MNVIHEARLFMGKPFNLLLTIALALIGSMLLLGGTSHVDQPASNLTVHFFFLPTCPHCHEQMAFNEKLMLEFPDVKFAYHDVSETAEQQLLLTMAKEHNISQQEIGVPATFLLNHSFIGFGSEESTGADIRSSIKSCIESCNSSSSNIIGNEPNEIEIPLIGPLDVSKFSLLSLSITLGFIDGFNPCAMWVLVYLIAIIMELNDRKRIWFLVGTFLLSSGILYFLFMTAWLNAFLFLGYVRIITILIGLFAMGAGILSLKEFFESKGSLVCKVVDVDDKKKTMNRIQELVSSPITIATFFGIIALAFAVNSIEFVCSSAIPAVFTQVLALSSLPVWEYYGYILIYVFFFMLDDLIIFSFAIFAIFGGLGEKYAKYCRLIGGVVMLVLGILLLFAPNLLR